MAIACVRCGGLEQSISAGGGAVAGMRVARTEAGNSGEALALASVEAPCIGRTAGDDEQAFLSCASGADGLEQSISASGGAVAGRQVARAEAGRSSPALGSGAVDVEAANASGEKFFLNCCVARFASRETGRG